VVTWPDLFPPLAGQTAWAHETDAEICWYQPQVILSEQEVSMENEAMSSRATPTLKRLFIVTITVL
jgi:hypothetical protein